MYKGKAKNGEIEILKEDILLDNKFFKVSNDYVEFPGDTVGTYLRVDSKNEGSVAVLPVLENGDILLIQIFRHGSRKWGYEVTKGCIEKGEMAEETAKRELLEETGLESDNLVLIDSLFELPAIYSGEIHCFIAYNCKKVLAEPKLEIGEAISGSIILKQSDDFKIDRNKKIFCKDVLTKYIIAEYKELRDNIKI